MSWAGKHVKTEKERKHMKKVRRSLNKKYQRVLLWSNSIDKMELRWSLHNGMGWNGIKK